MYVDEDYERTFARIGQDGTLDLLCFLLNEFRASREADIMRLVTTAPMQKPEDWQTLHRAQGAVETLKHIVHTWKAWSQVPPRRPAPDDDPFDLV